MKKKEQLIKSKERVRIHAEVFTPSWLVKDMCDRLPNDAWSDIHNTFLEPSCGTGNFLVEILERKLNLCQSVSEGFDALSSIYGIDIQEDNVQESRQRMYVLFTKRFGQVFCEVWDILRTNIVCADSLKLMSFMDGNNKNETVKKGWGKANKLYQDSLTQKEEVQISLF